MNEVKISKSTLQGLYLILCGIPYNHSGSEVYPEAIPLMNSAHQEIINLGKELGFDTRGYDLKINK